MPHEDRSVLRDDFLGWLRFVNAGMLDDGNIIAMKYALQHIPAGAVVEIGSFCGLSTNVLAHLRRIQGQPGPFFTCDPWIFEGADKTEVPMGNGGITFGDYRELVRDSFLRNVRAFSRNDLPYSLELPSDDFFTRWRNRETLVDVFGRNATPGGPIAFAYIDGDHRYGQAKSDFDNVDTFLAPGGYVLFDDSADGSGWEVCDLVKEIETQRKDYELVDRFPNYMFKKIR